MPKTIKTSSEESDSALFWLAVLFGTACVLVVLAIIVSNLYEKGRIVP